MPTASRTISNTGSPIVNVDGVVLAGATVTFELTDLQGSVTDTFDSTTFERIYGSHSAVTDANGEFTIALWPNDSGTTNTMYKCTVDQPGVAPVLGFITAGATVQTWYSFKASTDTYTPEQIVAVTALEIAIQVAAAAAAVSETNAAASAVAAGAIATASAGSAAAALVSEGNAAADVLLTNADVVLTHADVVLTHADVVLIHADVVSTAASAAGALVSENNAAVSAATIPAPVTGSYVRGDALGTAYETRTVVQTLTDLSLNNVNNTSDVNKPVSTLQAAADTATLNSAKSYADGLVVGLWDDRGSFDASVSTFPTTGGSGTAGAILKGDIWTISVAATSGPLNGIPIGSTVRAMVDTPAQTVGNWDVLGVGTGYVPAQATGNPAQAFSVGVATAASHAVNLGQTYRRVSQVQFNIYNTALSGTTIVPLDMSIPQNTEGNQYMTVSITPVSATSLLRIQATMQVSNSVANSMAMSLFRDANANALCTSVLDAVANSFNQMTIDFVVTSASVSATTFNIRVGGSSPSTTRINSIGASQYYGAASLSSMIVTEYLPTV